MRVERSFLGEAVLEFYKTVYTHKKQFFINIKSFFKIFYKIFAQKLHIKLPVCEPLVRITAQFSITGKIAARL